MKKLILKLNYSSNYKISLKSKRYWLFCKKFLSFLFLLNFFKKKNKFLCSGFFFFKKKKQNIITILKAPYKNKTSRNQLTFSRYFFKFNLLIFFEKKLIFFENTQIFCFLNNLNYFFFFFESNICFLKSQKLLVSAEICHFFKLTASPAQEL